MDLFHVLVNIQQFSEHDSIYVERPWTLESEAQVLSSSEDAKIISIENKVFEYFLDISIVDELLAQCTNQNLCIRDTSQRIVEFAINTGQLK
ncbi:hypothetical protein [Acinetobacter terrestris]|uniref:Uncharacterized protein n=1 Tax=Acinetobacter terrestris TaxID=2529843 RepID=A0ABX1UTX5_9GAMM|nr:hypothetical protein [Acinetobacter terrestris]NNH26204.1 hypothetical protein [Acinetobacter terrestris]TCB67277.1 hypothetical protein E0H81_04425 [Acinetobacter terrestris]